MKSPERHQKLTLLQYWCDAHLRYAHYTFHRSYGIPDHCPRTQAQHFSAAHKCRTRRRPEGRLTSIPRTSWELSQSKNINHLLVHCPTPQICLFRVYESEKSSLLDHRAKQLMSRWLAKAFLRTEWVHPCVVCSTTALHLDWWPLQHIFSGSELRIVCAMMDKVQNTFGKSMEYTFVVLLVPKASAVLPPKLLEALYSMSYRITLCNLTLKAHCQPSRCYVMSAEYTSTR